MRIIFITTIGSSSARQLCSCDMDDVPQPEIAAIDLAFIPRNSPLWLGRLPRPLAEKAIEFLSHRVSNNPRDLLAHLQRVAVHYSVGTVESLYGALLDLFIALDTNGHDLRKRLFMKCAPFFNREQQKALIKGLESGIKATDRVPLTPTSLLKYPSSGNMRLVERHDGHAVAENDFDVLDEARDLIDSGFIDEARMLLEELLLTRPECEETNKELLDLYKYTKNKKAFFATRERLDGLPLALTDTWDELAERFMGMEERVGNE